jgi:hypothetical protein
MTAASRVGGTWVKLCVSVMFGASIGDFFSRIPPFDFLVNYYGAHWTLTYTVQGLICRGFCLLKSTVDIYYNSLVELKMYG